MGQYILTEIFTLVPKEVYTPELGRTALTEQFGLQGEYDFYSALYEKAGAVVAYALPSSQKTGTGVCHKAYPFAIRLLQESEEITGYNKVILHYNSTRKLSHTIICTGEELKLANSFKADSFESALYFLFLSIQQLQMNPKQCIVRVCNEITEEQEKTISRFFNGVEKNNLDNLIQI